MIYNFPKFYKNGEARFMSKYYDNLDNLRKQYFNILSPTFPEWLLEYIDTPEMERLSGISMICGTDYSKIYNYISFNSL